MPENPPGVTDDPNDDDKPDKPGPKPKKSTGKPKALSIVVKPGRTLPVKGGIIEEGDPVARIHLEPGVTLNILADAIRSGRADHQKES